MTSIYLDHSATTPCDPRVVEVMLPYFTEVYGNASSSHRFGQKAERAIEDARETIAHILGCQPAEVIFTSGGSESDNLAVRGGAWSARQQGRGQHLLTTPIEHGAIGKTIDQLVAVQGFDKSLIAVDHYGQAQVVDFRAACQSNSVLVSVMYANNEVGTIEPITELARAAHDKRILFHTDAVQAAGQLPLNVQQLGVDLLSISGHKFYGPKGVGALYVRDGVNLTTAQTGGSHERGLRAGTHNTPLIVGLAKALELAYTEYDERIAHLQARRDQLIAGILAQIPNAILTGHPEERLPGHASFVFEQIDSSLLLNVLDAKGIAASAASACKTGSVAPSSVLLALGYPAELAAASLRLTVGIHTTEADIDYAIATIADVIQKLTFKTQVAV